MFNKSFENITRDVGKELKETARRIYVNGMRFFLLLLIIETIFAIGAALGEGLFALIIAVPFAALIEYLIIMGTIHLITINLYAKGEMVHLLQKCDLEKREELRTEDIFPEETIVVTEEKEENEAPIEPKEEPIDTPVAQQEEKPMEETAPSETPKKPEAGKMLAQKIAGMVFVQERKAPEVHLDDTWTCSSCGTTNAMKYGQCKKCGKFKKS